LIAETTEAPLSQSVQESFTNGVFAESYTARPLRVYRVQNVPGSPTNGDFGGFYSFDKPLSRLDAEIQLNIRMYGNYAADLVEYEIPKGTRIYTGGVEGGTGRQIFIRYEDRSVLQKLSAEPLFMGGDVPPILP